MKKQLLILPSFIFFLILIIFFYLLIIDRNPSEIPSNLIDKKIPNFETNSLLKNEKFISANGIEVAGIEYITDKNGTVYTYDVNTNTNYNSQAEKVSKIKGMKSIAEFLKKELLLVSNIKVVA